MSFVVITNWLYKHKDKLHYIISMETVLTNGFVRLVDTMPREDLDDSIVQAARVSYGDGTTASRSPEGLIRYLLRHWHTTPFEMIEFKFHMKMPIFVARQHLRHRMASVNEVSARYSVVNNDVFIPKDYRVQSSINKQSSEGVLENSETIRTDVTAVCEHAFQVYNSAIDGGCSRELARCHLPQSTFTEFYWKINLHNLLHYLQLRMDSGAQTEIRMYAHAIYKLVEPLVPLTMKAFMDFRVNSIQLTGPEIALLVNNQISQDEIDLTPGEKREFIDKLKRMGLFKTNGVQ